MKAIIKFIQLKKQDARDFTPWDFNKYSTIKVVKY